MRIKFAFIISLLLLNLKGFCFDFKVQNDQNVTLYFNLTSSTECELTNSGFSGTYSGDIIIPETVEYMGKQLKVTSIAGSKKVGNTIYAQSVFSNCINLTSVSIPNTVTKIGYMAFSNCGLSSIVIPNSVESIEEYAFSSCANFKEFNLPNSIKSIGNAAFFNCENLETINMGDNVTTLGSSVFSDCPKLKSVVLSEELQYLPASCFEGCSSLVSIVVPDKVSTINKRVFYGCTELKEIVLGQNVSYINDEAFKNCNITNVKIKASIPPRCNSTSVFDYTGNVITKTFQVPNGTKDAYENTIVWKDFWEIQEYEIESIEQCETPIISYQNGKVSFDCATKDVEFISEIVCHDVKSYMSSSIDISATYIINVYAIKEGTKQSDVATAILCWLETDPKTVGITGIDRIETSPLLISSSNGELKISGPENCSIQFYSISGTLIGTERIENGSCTFPTNEKIVIVKVNGKSIKVSNGY